MRELCRVSCLVLGLLAVARISFGQASTITGLTLSPTEALAGATISATATGSGACGAVNIDWGDGAAITYATATLPVTQTHVYQTAGTFTVRAQGMGNCAGQATARLTIKAPPPPPPEPAAGRLTAIEVSPASAAPRSRVAITLQGAGPCRMTLDFGDGNTQELNGDLPMSARHAYAAAGSYTIVASPTGRCTERRTTTVAIGAVRQTPRIAAIEVASPPGTAAGIRSIRIAGNGLCTYVLDYGDGNDETRTATLPEVMQHNYPAEGRYTIVATAQPPCAGTLRSTIVVGRDLRGAMTRVEARPQLAAPAQPITITVAGSGMCRFTIDFGDGESRTLTESLPHQITYRYPRPGNYEVFVWTEPPCSGDGEAVLRIRRR